MEETKIETNGIWRGSIRATTPEGTQTFMSDGNRNYTATCCTWLLQGHFSLVKTLEYIISNHLRSVIHIIALGGEGRRGRR